MEFELQNITVFSCLFGIYTPRYYFCCYDGWAYSISGEVQKIVPLDSFDIKPNIKKTIHYNHDNSIYLDGKKIESNLNLTSGDANIYLFSRNRNGIEKMWDNGIIKLYGCKIFDGERMVKDYRPAKDFEEKVCLWEDVQKKFVYTMQGTLTEN